MKTLTICFIYFFCFTLSSYCQWQPDLRLTNASGNSLASHNNTYGIAVNGNIVHVVWYDERDGNSEIYYKRSTVNGMAWETDMRLTSNSANSFFPSISSFGSYLFVVWCDYRDGNGEVYFKVSQDAGSTWSADTRLTNSSGSSTYPCILSKGQEVHLVWEDWRHTSSFTQPEIYYQYSSNAGEITEGYI